MSELWCEDGGVTTQAVALEWIAGGRAFEPAVLQFAARFAVSTPTFQALLAAVKAAGAARRCSCPRPTGHGAQRDAGQDVEYTKGERRTGPRRAALGVNRQCRGIAQAPSVQGFRVPSGRRCGHDRRRATPSHDGPLGAALCV